jgi:hypothetical protein
LCYHINKALGVDFVRIEELNLFFSADKLNRSFNRYAYFPENQETEFYVLSNKGSEGILIPEMNGVDYFLLIKNFIDDEDLALWLKQIKGIPDVIAAVEVEPKKLKSKENLLF